MSRFQDLILQGIRADQPLATDVSTGTIYSVTDEGFLQEQSDGAAWSQFGPGGGSGGVSPFSGIIQGRLTTETGVPVSAADRTAQGTIYYTPSINGLAITTGATALWNGSSVVVVSFTQKSLALTATSGKIYDVFLDYNAGTPQLVLSAEWTNDTTRADALGAQSGLIVKSGTSAYRWLGTIRASGANVTADSNALRFVWNAYNQVPRKMLVQEATNSWNYTLTAYQQANASAANQLAYVTGDAAALISANVQGLSSASNATAAGHFGIGVDSATVTSATTMTYAQNAGTSATSVLPGQATYEGYPGLGYHFLTWLEAASVATGTTTFYGDGNIPTIIQTGISGRIWN